MINEQILNKGLDKYGFVGLAQRASVSTSTLSQLRSGKYRSPMRAETKQRLAKALGVSMKRLFPTPPKGESIIDESLLSQ